MTESKYVTPRVRASAARLGVDLQAVTGTGVGGRITEHDVSMAKLAAIEADLNRKPVRRTSVTDKTRNPLVAQAYAHPLAPKRVPPPTLFPSGDIPAMTASGIPSEMVLEVPWQARHALASAPTLSEAYAIHAACTGPEGDLLAELDYRTHPGNAAYQQRVDSWMMAGDPRTPERWTPPAAPVDTMPALTAAEQQVARDLGLSDKDLT